MAICVALRDDGTLSPTGESVDQCTGYVMVSSGEYGVYQVVQTAFAAPTAAQASSWFFGCWGAVMGMYLMAKVVGAVVSMFKH